jgi:DNA-binding transcriptional ArsR family regulator
MVIMTKQVVLDEGSFKALSSDTRIGILKNLKIRRHTLSELSKTLSLGTSTIKEHCDVLKKANLIEQFDEGRKWKYYALTEKGKQVIAPSLYDDIQVLITLCLTIVVLSGALFFFFGYVGSDQGMVASVGEQKMDYYSENILTADATATISREPEYVLPIEDTNLFSMQDVIAAMAASLILGIFLGWTFKKNNRI